MKVVVATACALWLAGFSPARAAALDDAVPDGHGLTYFDLIKRVIPDLTWTGSGATGRDILPFTHINGDDLKADPDSISLDTVNVIPIADDSTRTILSFDLGRAEGSLTGAKFLALFSLSPTVKLIDLVEVGEGRVVAVSVAKPAPLGPRTPLILVHSWHDNSNQSYDLWDIVFIRNGTFRLIDTVFTLGESLCSYSRTQSASIETALNTQPYRAVQVTVREVVMPREAECGDERPPPAETTFYRATYRWNPEQGTFTTPSRELIRLEEANRERM